ncbi:MAG: hypothetical protein Ct9H90mP8_1380 [Pseudomonadota bacterium]|nr:MAG: hypothetical protein Ct9H90mP8_1380 [Pseudomonadota bacterium]
MEEAIDGEYQALKPRGAYTRLFFLASIRNSGNGSNMSDEDIWRLNRGGHDPQKFMRFSSCVKHKGNPRDISKNR